MGVERGVRGDNPGSEEPRSDWGGPFIDPTSVNSTADKGIRRIDFLLSYPIEFPENSGARFTPQGIVDKLEGVLAVHADKPPEDVVEFCTNEDGVSCYVTIAKMQAELEKRRQALAEGESLF